MAANDANTDHPDPFGATLRDDGRVTFRVWAPRGRQITLIIEPATAREVRLPLLPIGEGFFALTTELATAGTRYLLQRDHHRPQPDPASQFQPAGVWGPSEVVDHRFAWNDSTWRGISPAEMVLYELHVGAFTPQGDYAAVIERLDHLIDVGINAIKLMPLAQFPGTHNWGYDGVFHLAPFCGYGRPQQLKRLIDACHERGIAVLLDVVTNHFGPEGNAMWLMARSFFARNNTTPWGPGPRFDLPPVLAYFAQMARAYRRDYHFDGLRIDAFDAIAAPQRHEHLKWMVEAIEAELGPDDRAIVLLESEDNELDLLRCADRGVSVLQLGFDFQRATHRLLTGEAHQGYSDYDAPAELLAQCASDGFCFLQRFSQRRQKQVGDAPRPLPWAVVVNYLQNHDTAGNRYRGERLDALVDEQTVRAALAYLLLQPAVPYLFMGSEWGSQRPFYFFCQFGAELDRRIARSRRREFVSMDRTPTLPRPPEPHDPEALACSTLDWAEARLPRHAALLTEVKHLLALRRQLRPCMADHTSDIRARATRRCLVLEIAGKTDERFVLLANFNSASHPLPAGQLIYSTAPLQADDILPGRATALLRLALPS